MEVWNLYTQDRKLTNETHIRGIEIPDNRYHLVVHVWLKNPEGKYLLTQRAANRKRLPLVWECTCGSALLGESSLQSAIREVTEEVGIEIDPQTDSGAVHYSCIRKYFLGKKYNDILDVWVFETSKEPDLLCASTDEVAATKWLTVSEIHTLWQSGEMNPEMEYFFSVINKEA